MDFLHFIDEVSNQLATEITAILTNRNLIATGSCAAVFISEVGPQWSVTDSPLSFRPEAACPKFLGERMLRAKFDF